VAAGAFLAGVAYLIAGEPWTPGAVAGLLGSAGVAGYAFAVALAVRRGGQPSLPRDHFRALLPPPAVMAVGVGCLGLVLVYARLAWDRRGWETYPEMRGRFVSFEGIPAFRRLRARAEIVRSYEQLAAWLGPRIAAEREAGTEPEVFIFPQGQLMYGALGLDSFRGVRLWYHADLSYRGEDPDTGQVRRALPRYVVVFRCDREYLHPAVAWIGRQAIHDMPGLVELVEERYRHAAQLDGWLIYERRPESGGETASVPSLP
jgi:hypothetical protein